MPPLNPFICPGCEEEIEHIRVSRRVYSYENGYVPVNITDRNYTYRTAENLAEGNIDWDDSPTDWDPEGEFSYECPECSRDFTPDEIWGNHPSIVPTQTVSVQPTGRPRDPSPRPTMGTTLQPSQEFARPKRIGGSETISMSGDAWSPQIFVEPDIEITVCPTCHRDIAVQEDDRICTHCGTSLES